jgi:hypothetical protein
VGVLFHHTTAVGVGKEEAILLDPGNLLQRIEIAYRVNEESAVPLALPKQIVFGGSRIELKGFRQREGDLVALTLEDGSSIFKRVGRSLAGDLAHLMQFESIGGLGSSVVLSLAKSTPGIPAIMSARLIIGVLYNR